MSDDKPSLHIDTDWKKQAQEEKRRLAEEEQKRAAEREQRDRAAAAPPLTPPGAAAGLRAARGAPRRGGGTFGARSRGRTRSARRTPASRGEPHHADQLPDDPSPALPR